MNLEKTRAAINLHAILRDLEDLSGLDEDTGTLLRGHQLKIGFHVPGLEPLTLEVNEGRIQARRGSEPGGLRLRFFSPRHFNGMVEGKQMPIPTGGFKHLGFLQNNFTALAKDLEKYLKPSETDLLCDAFREKNTRLTASAALFALAEIAGSDPRGLEIARAMGEGAVRLEVPGVLAYTIIAKDGKLATTKSADVPAQAFMKFSSLDTLGKVLRGEMDSFVAIGLGQIEISGRIPLVDNLNKLLRLVSFYLAEETT